MRPHAQNFSAVTTRSPSLAFLALLLAWTVSPAVAAAPAPAASEPLPGVASPAPPVLAAGVSLGLTEMFELIKQDSPRLRALQTEIDLARGEGKAAKVLPNPVLNLAILYLNSGFNQNGVATYYANVALPLLVGGQRRFRVKSANAWTRAAEAGVHQGYLELAAEGRALHVDLLAAQQRVGLYDAALAELAALESFAQGRQTAGLASEIEVLRISMTAASWQSRRIEAVTAREDLSARLAALVGRPNWRPWAAGEFAPVGVEPDAALWAEVERTQPAIEAARRREAHAVQGIALARREAVPVPSLMAGTVVIQNYYSASTTVGLTVPIPVFDWGQGLRARAEARAIASKREREAVSAEVEAELVRAAQVLKLRRDALGDYEARVVAQAERMRSLADDAFRAGKAEPADLVEAAELRFDALLGQVDLKVALMQAEVDLLTAAGRVEEVR